LKNLESVSLKYSYRSDTDNLVDDFYVPCMKNSVLYQRAVGYFTSSSLNQAAQGVAHLLSCNGKIELVCSPVLDESDLKAIREGVKDKESIIIENAEMHFKNIHYQIVKDRLNALSWMISEGLLVIKLAIRIDARGLPVKGIYHEKMGIFADNFGNKVAFSGSSNETTGGLVSNFEVIDVFHSWRDSDRCKLKQQNFNNLWENTTKKLEVLDFTDVSASILNKYKQVRKPTKDPSETTETLDSTIFRENSPILPLGITLRDYQKQAIQNWLKRNGKGIFEMATGSGKTITALGAVAQLSKSTIGLDAIIVIVPYQHLVTQWDDVCRSFGMKPVLAYKSSKKWIPELAPRLFRAGNKNAPFLSVIVTNSTFCNKEFQSKLEYFPKKTILIADEVHNLGAKQIKKMLPDRIPWRLGLSATPERWLDSTGTSTLFDYFGKPIEPPFTLSDAIKKGALVEYEYFPIFVELTDDEMLTYIEISERIAKLIASGQSLEDEESTSLKNLLFKRARILGLASNKLIVLKELMQDRLDDLHYLFYCGAGMIESDQYFEDIEEIEMKQIDAVCKILGYELGFRIGKFVAETSIEERVLLKSQLANGQLQGLVAIRCLDEGVDIPSIKTAVILASSSNPRQFIQRRGRILRRSTKKEKATIYDMIVLPPNSQFITSIESKILRKEMSRYLEFANSAMNSGSAKKKVIGILEKYNLLDM